jgi:hypothetical protein
MHIVLRVTTQEMVVTMADIIITTMEIHPVEIMEGPIMGQDKQVL